MYHAAFWESVVTKPRLLYLEDNFLRVMCTFVLLGDSWCDCGQKIPPGEQQSAGRGFGSPMGEIGTGRWAKESEHDNSFRFRRGFPEVLHVSWELKIYRFGRGPLLQIVFCICDSTFCWERILRILRMYFYLSDSTACWKAPETHSVFWSSEESLGQVCKG